MIVKTVTRFEWSQRSGKPISWRLPAYKGEGNPHIESIRGDLAGLRLRLELYFQFDNLCIDTERARSLPGFIWNFTPAMGVELLETDPNDQGPGHYRLVFQAFNHASRQQLRMASMRKWCELWAASGHSPSSAPPAPRVMTERYVHFTRASDPRTLTEGEYLLEQVRQNPERPSSQLSDRFGLLCAVDPLRTFGGR